jgi:hypothetical protein
MQFSSLTGLSRRLSGLGAGGGGRGSDGATADFGTGVCRRHATISVLGTGASGDRTELVAGGSGCVERGWGGGARVL